MNLIHVIPVGGTEPVHHCHETCWCHPLVTEEYVIVHHAKDLREVRERQGTNWGDGPWVNVIEVRP